MAKLIIGMGLPGAGKSTLLKEFCDKYDYDYIRVDDIRKEFGLTSAQASTEEVWNDIRSRTLDGYWAGRTVVVDATFLGDARKKFIDFARANGVEKIQGLLVDTPEEIAWIRNQSREDKTSRELFEDRLSNLKNFPPEITDGLDSLFVLNEHGELLKAELPGELKREFKPKQPFS